MVRVTSVNLDVPLGTKIQDLITALIELEKIYHNVSVSSFDYDSISFNIEDEDEEIQAN